MRTNTKMQMGQSGCIAAVLLSALLFKGAAKEETYDGWGNLEIDPRLRIGEGWNLISLALEETDTGTDRNISIVSGWNLIGHSSPTAVSVADLTFDLTPASASSRKYKYAGTSGVDSTQLVADTGYWFNSRQAGTLTLPSAGGTLNAATFAWSQLRFHNGTDELNITDADIEGWIGNALWVPVTRGTGFSSITSGNLNPWKGYFIKSYKDNITLIRQN